MDSGADHAGQGLLQQAGYRLSASGLNLSFDLSLPKAFRDLMRELLSGWIFDDIGDPGASADLQVLPTGNAYRVFSTVYDSGRRFDDFVDTLNEALVALAYLVRSALPGRDLVHAAGIQRTNGPTVVFGTKKAGTSVLTARAAAAGARIWGDDLLLWDGKRREFTGLGLAPRLRRPVLPDLLTTLGQDRIIAGRHTCYLRAGKIDLAPAGTVLRPDHLVELQPDQTERQIGLLSARAAIAGRIIP